MHNLKYRAVLLLAVILSAISTWFLFGIYAPQDQDSVVPQVKIFAILFLFGGLLGILNEEKSDREENIEGNQSDTVILIVDFCIIFLLALISLSSAPIFFSIEASAEFEYIFWTVAETLNQVEYGDILFSIIFILYILFTISLTAFLTLIGPVIIGFAILLCVKEP